MRSRKTVIGIAFVGTLVLFSILVGVFNVMNADVSADFEIDGILVPITISKDKWTIVPEWQQTPTLDGRINEEVWGNAAVLDGFTTPFYEKPVVHDVSYKLAYDQEYLYVGGTMAREEAASLAHIEVVIRPTKRGDDHYVASIPVKPDSNLRLSTNWNVSVGDLDLYPGRINIRDFTQKTAEQEGKFDVEVAIPLKAVVPTGVVPGDEWQLNIIHVHNLYTQPLNSWIPLRHSEHWHQGGTSASLNANVVDHNRLGSIYFQRLPEQAQAIAWEPQQATLSYQSFTNKVLTVDLPSETVADLEFSLQWKEPNDSWQSLKDVQIQRKGKELTVLFHHPASTALGWYELALTAFSPSTSSAYLAILSFDNESMIQAGRTAQSGLKRDRAYEVPTRNIKSAPASTQVQETIALIPPQPGFRFVGLPEMPELYQDGLYNLSPDGHHLVAPRTGTTYPNDRFKEDKVLEVKNGKGEIVSIPYHEDDKGNKYFISAHMWYLQMSRAVNETNKIARTDPLGAARLLYEFVKAYEGYNPTVDRIAGSSYITHSQSVLSGPPYAYWGGIWNRWYLNDLSDMGPLLSAFRTVKLTDAFEVLSKEVGEDVEQKIIQDMFIPSADQVLSRVIRYGNMSFRPWMGLVNVGKTLEDPDYIHLVVQLVEEFVSKMFLGDGFWKEVTIHYHEQTINELVALLDQLQGWTDPEGYISPRTGKRFDNLDMKRDFPVVTRAMEIANRLVYPDGKVLPIMDTWANGTLKGQGNDVPLLLPGAGIGRLAAGEGRDQTQLYLSFQPKYGHNHRDPLNLNLFAQGQELLPDIGYSHNTIYRWFALSTIGHNTVLVDSQNASNNDKSQHGGNIHMFVPDGGSVQAMRASYESAYPDTQEYSREPWFVSYADGAGEQGYVLDLFRVSGGNRHEYTLQGDANRDATLTTNMALTPYGPYLLPEGTSVTLPTNNSSSGSAGRHFAGYIYVRDVQQAQIDGDQYQLTMTTTANGKELAKLNITGLLESGNNELFLGRSPSLRSTRLHGMRMDNNDEALKYDMPKLVLRRDGRNLESTFVTVMEAYQDDAARIDSIERLYGYQEPEGAVAVQVNYGNTTDILLSNPHHPDQPFTIGDLTLLGEMGFIRIVNGEVQEMTLASGTLLKKGSQQVTGSGRITGKITDTQRVANGDRYDAFVIDQSIPEDVAGRYIIVENPDGYTKGYEIEQVVQEDGRTLVVLAEHDPGIEIFDDGTSQQMFFPNKRWTGQHQFSIGNVSHLP